MVNNSNNMTWEELEILDPVAPSELNKINLTQRNNILNGQRIGLFWNRKPNGDVLLDKFADNLKKYYENINIVWLQGKNDPGRKASSSSIDEVLDKCEIVFLAAGD